MSATREPDSMSKIALCALPLLLLLATACSTSGRSEWQRVDVGSDPAAVREQRAKDLADCTITAGAPTTGGQSTFDDSRAQVQDCMRARGWQLVPVSGA
jgi:hypothetical protein